jgi:hypothetical protein
VGAVLLRWAGFNGCRGGENFSCFVSKSRHPSRILYGLAIPDGTGGMAGAIAPMVLELSRIVLEWFSNNPRNGAEWCAKLLELC